MTFSTKMRAPPGRSDACTSSRMRSRCSMGVNWMVRTLRMTLAETFGKSVRRSRFQDLGHPGINEGFETTACPLQHGPRYFHSDVAAAAAEALGEGRQSLAERAAKIQNIGPRLHIAQGQLGHGVAHHLVLGNRAFQHVVEDRGHAGVELPALSGRGMSEAAAHDGILPPWRGDSAP